MKNLKWLFLVLLTGVLVACNRDSEPKPVQGSEVSMPGSQPEDDKDSEKNRIAKADEEKDKTTPKLIAETDLKTVEGKSGIPAGEVSTPEPASAEPTPKPAVEEPPEPAVEEPPKPAVEEPPEPASAEPTPKPAVEEPPEPAAEELPEPASAEPTPKPAVEEPPEPASAEPTPKPAVEEPPEPASAEPTPKPAVEEPPKPAVEEPPEPAAEEPPEPAPEPTPRPAVEEMGEVDSQEVLQKEQICQFKADYLIDGLEFNGSTILIPSASEMALLPEIILKKIEPEYEPFWALRTWNDFAAWASYNDFMESEDFVKREYKRGFVVTYTYDRDEKYGHWCSPQNVVSKGPCQVEIVYNGAISLGFAIGLKGEKVYTHREQSYTYIGELTAQIYFNSSEPLDFSDCSE